MSAPVDVSPAVQPAPAVQEPVQASPSPEPGPVFPVPEPVAAVPMASGPVPAQNVQLPPTAEELAAAATPVTPDPPRSEDERLEPIPTGPVMLKSGIQVDVVPLRLRETMKLLKIVTVGAGRYLEPLMNQLNVEDPAEFARTLGALILMSIPDATEEAVAFVQAMVMPAGAAAMDNSARVEAIRDLSIELYNPDLDDVVSIVERVIRRESEDIRNLGKRIGQAFKLAVKVGELPKSAAAS